MVNTVYDLAAPVRANNIAVPGLPSLMLEPLVRAALLEDLGRAGDITTQAIVPAAARARAQLVARGAGVLAGLELARLAFQLLDADVVFEARVTDGARLAAGEVIASVEGNARALLSAERTALNFLCHLSGVASATAAIVYIVQPYGVKVTCTRKTLPSLRAVQKYAVRVGGGSSHRYGLDDAVLIKDNHIALAGGLRPAVERARAGVGHLVKIEVEIDTLAQLEEALTMGVDIVLLDNMPPPVLQEAVRLAQGRAMIEASGGITPDNAAEVAATGIDLMAIGWLTHSARALDIGLDA